MATRLCYHLTIVAVTALAASAARAQTFTIRGRVTTEAGVPVADATILVTEVGAPTSSPAAIGGTDSSGTYQVVLSRLASAYLVVVTKTGLATQRQQVARGPNDSFAGGVDFQLSAAAGLDTVRTVARRPRPRRDERNLRAGVGAAESTLGLGDALGGDLAGELAAALALVPGVSLTPDAGGALRPAAFALGAEQAGVTLNGSDVSGTPSAPRDGLLATVRLSTYDPRQGRAAGPVVNLTLPSGSYVVTHTLRGTLDDPATQTAPRAVPNAQYARQIVSGTASGPFGGSGRLFYNTTAQLDRRSSPLTTLATAAPASLAAFGVSAESAARALALASRAGVPLAAAGVPHDQRTTGASAMARVDFTPGFATPFGPGLSVPPDGDVAYLLASGSWSESGAGSALPLATSSRLTASRRRSGQLLADYETYRGPVLHVLRSSVTRGDERVSPYLEVPSVSVLAGGAAAEGTGLVSLALGGAGVGASRVRTTRWQTSSDASWRTRYGAHTFDVYADALYDRASGDAEPGLGTFAYASLDDFAAGRPSAFERTLGTRAVTGSAWKGVLAASDVYRPSQLPGPFRRVYARGLALQYGVRVDASRFAGAPAADPRVASRFGRRTDAVPNEIAVQPMVGFTWERGVLTTLVGAARHQDSRHVFTGGVRQYVGTLAPLAVAGVAAQGNSVNAETRLRCLGAAAPAPNWPAYLASRDAVPTRCADAPLGTPLTESAPSVAFYAPGYGAPRSWRGELRWQWRVASTFGSTLGVTQAVNRSLPSSVDLNLVPAQRFTLADERGRGVFADPAAFVPSTGAVAVTASRVAPELARVRELRDDGRSSQRLLTAGLTRWFGLTRFGSNVTLPPPPFSGTLDLTYTLAATRERLRGFDATTAGDPRPFAWSAGATPRHTVQLRLAGQREGWFTLSAAAQLSSGVAYTPLVRGDVNGDGLAFNDRAFVFDPAASDSALGTAMRRLLAEGPERVRSCLARQRGAIAAPASCRGGWFTSLSTVALTLDPRRTGLGGRARVSLYVTNALGAVDRILHGAGGARGWGSPSIPDATLLSVRGFEATTRRFRYDVNPRFGRDAAVAFGRPATLTLDVRLDVSPNRETQELTHLSRPTPGGKGIGRDSVSLSKYLKQTGFALSAGLDLTWITRDAKRYALRPGQVDTLRAINARLYVRRDSIYDDLTHYLVAPGRDLRRAEARERWHRAIVAAATAVYEAGREARALLTDEQYVAIQSATWPLAMLDYTPLWLARMTSGPLTYPR